MGERAELEQRILVSALREQRQLWEQLPSGSRWIYRVTFDLDAKEPNRTYLVSWNQVRDLTFTSTTYHWRSIFLTLGLVIGAVGLILIAGAIRRRG